MTSAQRYDVLFRGDIVPGRRLDDVKARVQALFQVDDGRLASLFSGRPVVIRRNLEGAEAERYREVLADAGAVVELRTLGTSGEATPLPDPVDPSNAHDWSLAPVGADLLRADERHRPAPVRVDIDHLHLAPLGADLLRPEERRQLAPVNIDTSGLGLQQNED